MKIYSSCLFFCFTFLIFSCSSTKNLQKHLRSSEIVVSSFSMNHPADIGTSLSGQKIKMGGFSGLSLLREEDQFIYFQTLTDRGPNGEVIGKDRPFLLPDFSPTIVTLKVDKKTNELSIIKELKLKKKSGEPITGLPNTRYEENPVDIFGLIYSIDSDGLDPEGITSDGKGGWWLAEEYGPSLVNFSEAGHMERRILPSIGLPKMYSNRKPNRGFEGIAKVGQKLFGILQSPLPGEKKFTRIVEVDLDSMRTSAEYFYPFEKGNDKIGDLIAINEKSFLVLEQNGKTGQQSQKFIYQINLGESDEPVKKLLIADLKNTPFNNVEKVEGLAIIDRYRLALVYDNDFQLNGRTDFKTGLTPLNDSKNQLIILEFKEKIFE